MPKCKNDPKKMYKGTEPNPKGFGYCAHAGKEGMIKKGKDGNEWIIKSNSKGTLMWIRHNSSLKDGKRRDIFSELNKSQLETINLLKKDIKNALKQIGVTLIFKNLKPINGVYIINYVWPTTYDILKDKFIIVVLKLDSNNKLYIPDKLLNCQHNNITYNTKKNVISIFKKYLKNKFIWDGSQKNTINIKL